MTEEELQSLNKEELQDKINKLEQKLTDKMEVAEA